MNLTTEQDLAERILQVPVEKAAELRRRHRWPHVRIGRFDVRYTDEQVVQIVEMHTAVSEPAKKTLAPVISGQTARSARRSS